MINIASFHRFHNEIDAIFNVMHDLNLYNVGVIKRILIAWHSVNIMKIINREELR